MREARATLPTTPACLGSYWAPNFAELRIGQEIDADLQELQIADERHAPIGIGQVAGLHTGAAQGVTRISPARAHVGVEAVDEAGQID